MMNRLPVRVCTLALLSAAMLLLAVSPARAQYRPRPLEDPATGEKYHIEAAASLWYPSANIFISSEGLGQTPTLINAKDDLGLEDKRLPQLQLILRPSTRNKFRFQYIPIQYTQVAAPRRSIVFNGQLYTTNIPVESTLDWKAYRFGYEYDFVTTNRGFGGFILEAKYTDVLVRLRSPLLSVDEFAQARAPIPAIGGIVRVYVVPNIAITAEVTGFKLPDKLIKDSSGHYIDFDLYGTLNFTNYIGFQAGFRALDLGYIVKADTGTFTFKGMYFGVVARY